MIKFGQKKYPYKIYDTLIIFNELELLKMRFKELYDEVDYFVIVEAKETFRGNPKPLSFQMHKGDFQDYLDKIIHIVIEERIETNDPWVREVYQRNQILRGLFGCNDHDVVFISDCDELICPKKVRRISNKAYKSKGKIWALRQDMYRFYLNRFHRKKWRGTTVTAYKTVKSISPDFVRQQGGRAKAINNAGWHFSNLGGHELFVKKVEAFAHQESDTKESKSLDNFNAMVASLNKVKIDRRFPMYVRKNIDLLKSLNYLEN